MLGVVSMLGNWSQAVIYGLSKSIDQRDIPSPHALELSMRDPVSRSISNRGRALSDAVLFNGDVWLEQTAQTGLRQYGMRRFQIDIVT